MRGRARQVARRPQNSPPIQLRLKKGGSALQPPPTRTLRGTRFEARALRVWPTLAAGKGQHAVETVEKACWLEPLSTPRIERCLLSESGRGISRLAPETRDVSASAERNARHQNRPVCTREEKDSAHLSQLPDQTAPASFPRRDRGLCAGCCTARAEDNQDSRREGRRRLRPRAEEDCTEVIAASHPPSSRAVSLLPRRGAPACPPLPTGAPTRPAAPRGRSSSRASARRAPSRQRRRASTQGTARRSLYERVAEGRGEASDGGRRGFGTRRRRAWRAGGEVASTRLGARRTHLAIKQPLGTVR